MPNLFQNITTNTQQFVRTNTKKLILGVCITGVILSGISAFTIFNGNQINKQSSAAPIYTCPAGQTLVGNNCESYKCMDNSNPDANGNCSVAQMGLFTCPSPIPAGVSIVFRAYSYKPAICSTRPDLFIEGTCGNNQIVDNYGYAQNPQPIGTVSGGYIQSTNIPINTVHNIVHANNLVVSYNGGDAYENIVNNFRDDNLQNNMCTSYKQLSVPQYLPEDSQPWATFERIANKRACPAGFGVFMFPTYVRHGMVSEDQMAMLCAKYSLNTTALASIAYGTPWSYRSRGCPAGFGAIVSVDIASNDQEESQICGPSAPQPVATVGQKVVAPATSSGYTIDNASVGTGTCTPTTIQQGQKTSCTFPLTGSSNGTYTIPPQGLNASIFNVANDYNTEQGARSDNCTVAGAVLTCNNLPTNANTIVGTRTVNVVQNGIAWFYNKGTVGVTAANCTNGATNPPTCNVCPAGFYFQTPDCLYLQKVGIDYKEFTAGSTNTTTGVVTPGSWNSQYKTNNGASYNTFKCDDIKTLTDPTHMVFDNKNYLGVKEICNKTRLDAIASGVANPRIFFYGFIYKQVNTRTNVTKYYSFVYTSYFDNNGNFVNWYSQLKKDNPSSTGYIIYDSAFNKIS